MVIQCTECKARYRAKNISPGQSAVRLKCPKCSAVFDFVPPPVAAEKTVSNEPGPAVLVVDDAKFFREILAEVLAPLNLQLVSVGTAGEALQMLQKQSFSLLLVDLVLPDMNGLDLMRKIRSDASYGNMKIMAISGAYRNDNCENDAIRAGADSFLSKSFTPDDLQQRIRKLLGP